MPFEKGNQAAAAKPGEELASSHLHMRCKPSEKSAWVKAAQARAKREGLDGDGAKLAAWVIDTLNAAAARDLAAQK